MFLYNVIKFFLNIKLTDSDLLGNKSLIAQICFYNKILTQMSIVILIWVTNWLNVDYYLLTNSDLLGNKSWIAQIYVFIKKVLS